MTPDTEKGRLVDGESLFPDIIENLALITEPELKSDDFITVAGPDSSPLRTVSLDNTRLISGVLVVTWRDDEGPHHDSFLYVVPEGSYGVQEIVGDDGKTYLRLDPLLLTLEKETEQRASLLGDLASRDYNVMETLGEHRLKPGQIDDFCYLLPTEFTPDPHPFEGFVDVKELENSQYSAAGETDQGEFREENQDKFYLEILPDGSLLAIVADGVGRSRFGEVAANNATGSVRNSIVESETEFANAADSSVGQVLTDAFSSADRQIRETTLDDGATTLTALLLRGNKYTIAHIGDSRAYEILESGDARQLTIDDKYPAEVLANELHITLEEAAKKTNIISRCLGKGELDTNEPAIIHGEISPGSILLLCTDGLYGNDTGEVNTLEKIVQTINAEQKNGPAAVAHALIELAKALGSRDNITDIFIVPKLGQNNP